MARDQQRLDQLAVADVAQTPDKQRQLGEGIAADKCTAELLNEICFFSVATRRCIDLHQILFTNGVNNDLPMTRWY